MLVGFFRKTTLALFLLFVAAACQAETPPEVETPKVVTVPEDDGIAMYQAGFVRYGTLSCSGVLVAHNVVLTAAHCVDWFSGTVDNPEESWFSNYRIEKRSVTKIRSFAPKPSLGLEGPLQR